MASLIGQGPRQYLLGCEDRPSFDGLKAALDEELRPADPIERMWVDEFVDLEWDLHRLRRTRHTVVEDALIERLTEKAFAALSYTARGSPPSFAEVKYCARGSIRGNRDDYEFISDALGILRMDDELQGAQAKCADLLARLEHSIHTTSRLRDAVLARLYSRRDLIADGRITSGRAR